MAAHPYEQNALSNFHNLLVDHQDRVNAIISKYIDRYKNSGEEITIDIWSTFIIDNAKGVIADLTQSGADVFNQAIVNSITLNTKDYQAIKEVNLDAAGKYQEELKILYDRIKK